RELAVGALGTALEGAPFELAQANAQRVDLGLLLRQLPDGALARPDEPLVELAAWPVGGVAARRMRERVPVRPGVPTTVERLAVTQPLQPGGDLGAAGAGQRVHRSGQLSLGDPRGELGVGLTVLPHVRQVVLL